MMSFEHSEHDQETERLLPQSWAERLSLWLKQLKGLVILALIGAVWLSLISWSNADPSLTHVTREAPRNLFGYPGAIVADLLLQTFGLAAVVVLLAPTLWAVEMLLLGRVPGHRQKLVLLPVSALILAGALSALPQAPIWPLDPGYGGILGDAAYRFAFAAAVTVAADKAGLVAGLILFAAGCGVLTHAIGLELKDLLASRAPGPVLSPIEPYVPFDPDRPERMGPPSMPHSPMPDGPAPARVHEGPRLDTGRLAGAFARHGAQAPPPPRWQPPVTTAAHSDSSAGHGALSSAHEQDRFRLQADPGLDLDGAGEADDDLEQLDPDSEAASIEMARRFAPGRADPDTWLAKAGKAAQASLLSRPGGPDLPPLPQMMSVPRSRAAAKTQPAPDGSQQRPSVGAPSPRGRSLLIDGMTFPVDPQSYRRPSLNLLQQAAARLPGPELTEQVLRGSARLLEDVLAQFGIKAVIKDIRPGPVVTLFELEPARGTKLSRVVGLADDVARAMRTTAVRVAAVPGRGVFGIEVPNMRRETVMLRDLLETEAYRASEGVLPLAIGRSIGGEPVVTDLAHMPHLLVAGTTGSGRSVGINAFILSLLYRHGPETCRLIMIDPQMLKLAAYNGIPHLLAPVITDRRKAVAALGWLVSEMNERYKRMAKLSVRNIDVFNNRVRNAKKRGEMIARVVQTGFDRRTGLAVYEHEQMDFDTMAYIVVVIEELADLMETAGAEVETAIHRLSQKARAAGIHLVVATQRPSADILTGTITANFPIRISYRVASKVESRAILGEQGAEQLLGHGDMLHQTGAGQVTRVHGAFVAHEDVEAITDFLRACPGPGFAEDLIRAMDGTISDGRPRVPSGIGV
ncbi:MAG: DNA translocase FtsK [Hyphomicrobiaceae bacterium]|nr:DNA translocase FtsK [Hyphomicrobiaceae bacterium]